MKIGSEEGRIVYIEPNNIPALKNAEYSDGVFPDNITWNPEDLNISVDLRVIIPSREHREEIDYEKNALFNPNYAGYTSLMSGTDLDENGSINMLTDDFTKVSYEEIRINGAGSKEMLGITSINIRYDAHLFPVVTMKFTDVRAASLMAPSEEAMYQKESGQDIACRNFFSSLFHFPYPIFELSIKGVYGTRVTYRLFASDFRSNYNGDTGNFDVTVKFIGAMFGTYTDIPFRMLLIAPYIGAKSGTTNEYWQKNTEPGGNFFYNEHGVSGGPIKTFLDYAREYEPKMGGKEGVIEDGEEGIEGLSRNTAEKSKINALVEKYKSFLNVYMKDENSIKNKFVHFHGKNNNATNMDEYFIIFFNDSVNKLEFSDSAYESVLSAAKEIENTCNDLSLKVPEIITKIIGTSDREDKGLDLVGPFVQNGKLILENSSILKNGLATEIANYNNGNGTLDGKKAFIVEENLIDTTDKRLREISDEDESLKKKASKEMMERFKRELGFEPTIENAFRMIFAHLDTFMYYFYKTINSIKPERKIKNFNIKIDDTDVQSDANDDAFLPPFTAFYRKADNGGGAKEQYYPGESTSNPSLRKLAEVGLVEEIFNGINGILSAAKPAEEEESAEIDNSEADAVAKSTEEGKKGFVVNKDKFKPICVLDFFYEGENPYNVLAGKDGDTQTNLLYFLAHRNLMLRMCSPQTTISSKKGDEIGSVRGNNLIKGNALSASKKMIVDGIFESENVAAKGVEVRAEDREIYNIKGFSSDGPKVDGPKFNDYENPDGFKNFIDLHERYQIATINGFYRVLYNRETTFYVNEKGHNILIPLSKDMNGENVPLYDPKNTGDTLLTEEKYANSNDEWDMIKKNKILTFEYSNKKYINGVNSDGTWRKPQKDFSQKDFIERKERGNSTEIDAWIPYFEPPEWSERQRKRTGFDIPLKKSDADSMLSAFNNNFLFSKGFKEIAEEKTEEGKEIGKDIAGVFFIKSLYENSPLDNVTYGNNANIRRVPKYAYLMACLKPYLFYCSEDFEEYEDLLEIYGLKKDVSYLIGMGQISRDYTSAERARKDNKKTAFEKARKSFEYFYDYFRKWLGEEWPTMLGLLLSERESGRRIYAKVGEYVIRVFDPNGSFMHSLVNFMCETAFPIYVNTNNINIRDNIYILQNKECKDIIKSVNEVKGMIAVTGGANSDTADTEANQEVGDNSISSEGIVLQDVDYSKNSTSQKASLYYTLKNLYDRWIATYVENKFKLDKPEVEEEKRRKRYSGANDTSYAEVGTVSEFSSFIFIDKFYNDISKRFIFNPYTLGTLLLDEFNGATEHSVLSFISELCRRNKLLFKSIPVYNNLYSLDSFIDMFTPKSPYDIKNKMGDGRGTTYIVMYPGSPSSNLGNLSSKKEGVGYKDDSFSIGETTGDIAEACREILNGSIKPDEIAYKISAFGVTPNSQNQSYFTKVSVGMDNPKVTEQSIGATLAIADLSGRGNSSVGYGAGQDIYPIYSKNSYDCRAEMLGCANIMPLMYFQLNNLPMFKGVYLIMSVEHNIQNNTMTTTFVGQRQSRYLIPMDSDIFNVAGLNELVGSVAETLISYGGTKMPYNLEEYSVDRYLCFDPNRIDPETKQPSPYYTAIGDRGVFMNRTFYPMSAIKQMEYAWYYQTNSRSGYSLVKGRGESDSDFYKRCREKGIGTCGTGLCASAVKAFLWAGFRGYSDKPEGTKDCMNFIGSIGNGFGCWKRLQQIGFRLVAVLKEITDEGSGLKSESGFRPQAGDVAVMKGGTYGHICMYNGENWVSDYVQKNLYCYSPSLINKKDDSFIMIFRYWGSIDMTETPKEYDGKKSSLLPANSF